MLHGAFPLGELLIPETDAKSVSALRILSGEWTIIEEGDSFRNRPLTVFISYRFILRYIIHHYHFTGSLKILPSVVSSE